MEIKKETILDSVTTVGRFSVRKQNYVESDNQKYYIGELERYTFNPGDFDALIQYAPEFEAMAQAMWTSDVILAWKAWLAEETAK